MSQSNRFCVIGAGPCGLTAVKNLTQRGIACDGFDRESDVGGTWRITSPASGVYASTHMISSKRLTEFTDYPMPKGWPPYPSHRLALQYLEDYARAFGLYDHFQFGTEVASVEPAAPHATPDTGWRVRFADGGERLYRGVVVANGHHWDPLLPTFPGEFDGVTMHAREYKSPQVFSGRRVLIVGAGNSGCDIAVDAVAQATRVFHSLRRGYYFLPKFLMGTPIDRCDEALDRWRLPLRLRRLIAHAFLRLSVGSPVRYGLPAPNHQLFETHPIVNSQLPYHVAHGDVVIKPNVQELEGDHVRFVDGSVESIDMIVYATGYRLSFPFVDSRLIVDDAGRPSMYLNAFHPVHDFLFVVGMIQPDGGIWPLADYQSQAIAGFIAACDRNDERADWFRRQKNSHRPDLGGGVRYADSPRHRLEVNYFAYRRALRRLIRRLG